MQKLTKLQRMGISLMLNNIRSHGAEWLNDGIIKFSLEPKALWILMFVYPNNRNYVYQFTLEWDENIDELIDYQFEYDERTGIFHVYMDNEMVGQS